MEPPLEGAKPPQTGNCKGSEPPMHIFSTFYNKNIFLIRFCSGLDQYAFKKILRKKKPITFFLANFLFIFLESFETFTDPSLNEVRAKLNSSSKFLKTYN